MTAPPPPTPPGPLGSGDGPIEIVEYDRSWPAAYLAECGRLAPLLPGVPILHIGSTAVPGLAAKPIIDMIAFVDDLDANVAELVRRAGYHLPARFNANLYHRRFLCYPTLSHRTHHLHLVDGHAGVDQCLRFRERLREDPALAAQYAALKRSLASRFREDRIGYTEAKSTFIKDAIRHPGTTSGTDPDRS
ncbi:MAG: GrpB family protein [Solirubrobacteraceae bacterium]